MSTEGRFGSAINWIVERQIPDATVEQRAAVEVEAVESCFRMAWEYGKQCANEDLEDRYCTLLEQTAAARELALAVHTAIESGTQDAAYALVWAHKKWQADYINGQPE